MVQTAPWISRRPAVATHRTSLTSQNKTNGVTQRRWLAFCNPPLRDLITSKLGSDSWIRDLYKLKALAQHADDAAFQEDWHKVKLQAKQRTAALVQRLTGELGVWTDGREGMT